MSDTADRLPRDWTIGTARLGPAPEAPAPEPTHWRTQTTTYPDGRITRHVHASRYGGNAADARRDLTRRWREAKKTFRTGPGWLEYAEAPPTHAVVCTVRLEWTDTDPDGPR